MPSAELLVELGAGRPGRLRAGVTLVAHGEFSVVLASLGAGSGVDADLPAVAAAYVLITAVAGPVLAKTLDRPPTPPSGVRAGGAPP